MQVHLTLVATATCWAMLVGAQEAPTISRSCPRAGRVANFNLGQNTTVTLQKSNGVPSMCNLVLRATAETDIPIARSYNNANWEFSGGRYAERFPIFWACETDSCSTTLPAGKYQLQSRSVPMRSSGESQARFLERVSFGATPNDLKNFPATWED